MIPIIQYPKGGEHKHTEAPHIALHSPQTSGITVSCPGMSRGDVTSSGAARTNRCCPPAGVLATTTRHSRNHDIDPEKRRMHAPSGPFSAPASTRGLPIPHAGHQLMPEPSNSSQSSSIHRPPSSHLKPTSHSAKSSITITSYPVPTRKDKKPHSTRADEPRSERANERRKTKPRPHFLTDHHRRASCNWTDKWGDALSPTT
jgi:hypothetical protein